MNNKNILNYFRNPNKTPKAKAKFLSDHYGSKVHNMARLIRNDTFIDFITLLSLELGSRPDNEDFIKEMFGILSALDEKKEN